MVGSCWALKDPVRAQTTCRVSRSTTAIVSVDRIEVSRLPLANAGSVPAADPSRISTALACSTSASSGILDRNTSLNGLESTDIEQ